MATAGPQLVLLDASVLVNFLRIDRWDLLANHPNHHFIITDHVRREITDSVQVARLNAALSAGTLQETTVNAFDEVVLFAQLTTRLGQGESAAIAAAAKRGLRVALDDRRAKKLAVQHCSASHVLDTVDLMVSLIHAGVIDVVAADAIKTAWEKQHRFRLKFKSFGERI